jgi:hypothetical protein
MDVFPDIQVPEVDGNNCVFSPIHIVLSPPRIGIGLPDTGMDIPLLSVHPVEDKNWNDAKPLFKAVTCPVTSMEAIAWLLFIHWP